jgi:hypothetical protein
MLRQVAFFPFCLRCPISALSIHMTKAVYLLISCSAILDRLHQEANRLQQTAEQIDGPALRATQPIQVLSPLEAMIAANAPAISIA